MTIHDDRIHACLDGQLPREALREEELRQLQALEAALADTKSALDTVPVPDLTSRVMEALPAPDGTPATRTESRLGRIARVLISPVTIAVRPAYLLAGVAIAVTGLMLLRPSEPIPTLPPVAAVSPAGSRMYVQFRVEVPGATRVALAGSFTSWQPEYELTEVSPGVWSAMISLEPGVYDYAFVIDGTRMMTDPHAPQIADSFGGSNSRLFLPAPNESA
ncbi:MAG: hypothetical protein GEU90_07690 [Gemmatimonas sp.]|nr:hypothetical protein [Gemmatimonas sp.]